MSKLIDILDRISLRARSLNSRIASDKLQSGEISDIKAALDALRVGLHENEIAYLENLSAQYIVAILVYEAWKDRANQRGVQIDFSKITVEKIAEALTSHYFGFPR